MMGNILTLPYYLLQNLDLVWTFSLLLFRFAGLMIVFPGIGGGMSGVRLRGPAIAILAAVSMYTSKKVAVPDNVAIMVAQLALEYILGMAIGVIPLLIVIGVQTGVQLATTSMGLGAAGLLDPTSGGSVSDLARIQGDIAVLLFLITGGHYVIIQAATGLAAELTPGAINITGLTAEWIVTKVATVFSMGIMVSAPVVIALLLTQFVMGLMAKAVPSVNIFIVSFPLTIGIGLILTLLSLPDLIYYLDGQYSELEYSISEVVETIK